MASLKLVTLSLLSLLVLGAAPGLCATSFKSQLDLFDFEKSLIDKASVAKSTIRFASYAASDSPRPIGTNATKHACKAFPGNADWPSDDDWKELAVSLNGTLLKPAPVSSVCYNTTAYGNYDAAACANITQGWATEFVRMDHPIEPVSPMFEGLTCLPPTPGVASTCTQGGYPVYAVNVSSAAHVQAAVNFARNKNIRLVVKNTGHDLSGKSLGAGSLSVWTHVSLDVVGAHILSVLVGYGQLTK